jgi:hypothetical protein
VTAPLPCASAPLAAVQCAGRHTAAPRPFGEPWLSAAPSTAVRRPTHARGAAAAPLAQETSLMLALALFVLLAARHAAARRRRAGCRGTYLHSRH